jgi:hypothetical protein
MGCTVPKSCAVPVPGKLLFDAVRKFVAGEGRNGAPCGEIPHGLGICQRHGD